MGRRKPRYLVLPTPAFLGARRRKQLCENSKGHIFPLPSREDSFVNTDLFAHQKPIIRQHQRPTLSLPVLGRELSDGAIARTSSQRKEIGDYCRLASAPTMNYEHMKSWVLPPKVHPKLKCSVKSHLQEMKPAGLKFSETQHNLKALPLEQATITRTSKLRELTEKKKEKQMMCSRLKETPLDADLPTHCGQIPLQSRDPLLYTKLKLNRTRLQTWHRAPVYQLEDPGNNLSALYMRPHKLLPSQFAIHPEWGM